MAVTLSDTFTDTDGTLLTAHDPDTGDAGSWVALGFGIGGTSPNDDLTISTNRVETVNSGSTDAIGAVCRNGTDPGADEYDIDVVMRTRSTTQNNRYTAALWRVSPTGTADGDVDRYLLLLNGSAGEWQLYKIVSGSLTLLESDAANYAASTTYDVHVEVRSSGTTMAVSVDDGGGGGLVEILTSTDTDITQRGRVGISTNRSGDGDIWLDTLTVDSVGGGTDATVTPGVIAATAAVPQGGVDVASGPAVTTSTTAAPRPSADISTGPAATSATASSPQASADITAGPAAVEAVASLPAVTVSTAGNATAAPATIAATVALARPEVDTGVAPAAVGATVAMPSASAESSVIAIPAAIVVVATLPTPALPVSAGPSAVAVVVSLPLVTVLASLPDPNPIKLTYQEPAGISHRESSALSYQEPPV